MEETSLEELVEQAIAGNKQALEQLIISIQDYVYNLAVRFFWNPLDAQDACQEILLKIITHLSSFQHRSTFKTWVYRVATNYLLNAKRTQYESLTFEEGAVHLEKGREYPSYEGADKNILLEEVKINCTTSMLICLSRPLRLTYLIGEILEYNSREGAYILDISPQTFRKRLSLARNRIRAFMAQHCGLYHPKNPCRCAQQISYSLAIGWFDPKNLNFVKLEKGIMEAKEKIDTFMDEVAIFHTHPEYSTPGRVLDNIRDLLDNADYAFLRY